MHSVFKPQDKTMMKLKDITVQMAKDTGLAIILILLILSFIFHLHTVLVIPTIVVCVITMTWPAMLKPLAILWFGLSVLLGSVVSRILLTLVFITVVTPIGLIRRISGADTLRLKQWKNGKESVFIIRNHKYSTNDLDKPY